MDRSRKIALVAAIAVLVVGIAIATRPSKAPPPPETWPADTVSTYAVDWRTRASASVAVQGKAELGSDIAAKGQLAIRSYGNKNGSTLLGMKWTKVDAASAIAMGRELVSGAELAKQLADADTIVAVDAVGRVLDVRFSAGTTPLARSVLRALVLEVCAEIAAASGEGDVETALGHAQVTRTDGGAQVMTRRTRYDSLAAFPDGVDPTAEGTLDANGEVDVGADNAIVAIKSNEAVTIGGVSGPTEGFQSKTDLSATLLGRKKDALGAPPDYAPAEPRSARKEEDRRASLQRRAVGVTYESLFADVRMVSVLPRAEATSWIWHDGAFLELHPEYAEKLLEQASRELDLTGQAAAFDIVVVSGTAQAQKALEAALKAWAQRDDHTYVVLVQRVGYLRRPSIDTLAFVDAEYAKHRGTDRGRACAYALGALAAAGRDEQAEKSNAIVTELVGDLAKAKSDDDRSALVRGLGNAGYPTTIGAIVAHRGSESADVRAAVAAALRKVDGPPVVDALLELVTDRDAVVAATAFASLFRKELDDATWARLHELFDARKISSSAHETLLSGLSARRGESPQVTAILVAIIASPDVDSSVRQRAESILRN